jgi:hypothetical protein
MVPGTRRWASSTNPKTWRSFGEASRAHRAGRHAGVGRIIAPEAGGFVRVDLDHCRDPETRIIDSRVMEILQDLDSYSELSPSGRGVKIWIRASLDRSYVRGAWRSIAVAGTSSPRASSSRSSPRPSRSVSTRSTSSSPESSQPGLRHTRSGRSLTRDPRSTSTRSWQVERWRFWGGFLTGSARSIKSAARGLSSTRTRTPAGPTLGNVMVAALGLAAGTHIAPLGAGGSSKHGCRQERDGAGA